jgi:hypothetical protein
VDLTHRPRPYQGSVVRFYGSEWEFVEAQ